MKRQFIKLLNIRNMETVIIIIGIIATILGIILFVKICRLSNDINKMSKVVLKDPYYLSNLLRVAHLKGNTFEVQDILFEIIARDILLHIKTVGDYRKAKGVISYYKGILENLGIELPEIMTKLDKDTKDIFEKL